MTAVTDEQNRPLVGISFILLGMAFISVNDLLVKLLSDRYPLHEIVFFRSVVGIAVSLILVKLEGGWTVLKTKRPGLHVARACLLVVANLSFFMALAAMPLAEATAIFFVAPLFMTILSFLILKERIGPRRIAAVLVGFCGVLVMLKPGGEGGEGPGLLVSLLPMVAALSFASFNILTRKLGASAKASAMAVYAQTMFIFVGIGFFVFAGDGRFAEGSDDVSMQFLFRAWSWPGTVDLLILSGLGAISAGAAYSLSQAYRSASAGTVAPFEYVALPLATFWGLVILNEVPDLRAVLGMMLILGAGLYVFWRERQRRAA
ncbi:DMT family transporter [Minwuia sp.]|uniref:DMT family transporter n=1 Tax=Minwuia sp. TaxID=2493630 RepID=UPI003A8FABF4